MIITSRSPNLDDFLRLPEEKPPLEYIDGAITQKLSPKVRHSVLQAALIKQLDASGIPNRVARALPELRATFAGASVVPDVVVLRWTRVPVDAEGHITDDLLQPPDIAIEIVSPEQSVTALVRRCLWYVSHGVQIALLVDPTDGSVLAFRPGQPTIDWHGSDLIDLREVLPDFTLTVDQLFAALELS